MIVRYTRRAQNDLTKILEYIEARSSQGGPHVKRAIRRAIETISEHPAVGHATGRDQTRGFPVSGGYPYLVYWTVEADEIWIIHIRHGARKSWKIKPTQ
jgi:plasmid stabilization system protein ParE